MSYCDGCASKLTELADKEREIARYKECAAVLREVVENRVEHPLLCTRAEQALAALDKEPKE